MRSVEGISAVHGGEDVNALGRYSDDNLAQGAVALATPLLLSGNTRGEV